MPLAKFACAEWQLIGSPIAFLYGGGLERD